MRFQIESKYQSKQGVWIKDHVTYIMVKEKVAIPPTIPILSMKLTGGLILVQSCQRIFRRL